MKSRSAWDFSDQQKTAMLIFVSVVLVMVVGFGFYFIIGWGIDWASFSLSESKPIQILGSMIILVLQFIFAVLVLGFAGVLIIFMFKVGTRTVAEEHKSPKKVRKSKLKHVIELPGLTNNEQVASVLKTLEECATKWKLNAEFEEGKISTVSFVDPDEATLFRLKVNL